MGRTCSTPQGAAANGFARACRRAVLQFDPAAASAVETARRTRDKAKLAESRTREGDAENQRLQVELEVRDTAVVTCRLQLRLRRHTCSPCVFVRLCVWWGACATSNTWSTSTASRRSGLTRWRGYAGRVLGQPCSARITSASALTNTVELLLSLHAPLPGTPTRATAGLLQDRQPAARPPCTQPRTRRTRQW